MKSSKVKLFFALFISSLLIIAATFLWHSARDEIFYLCGNFSAGVSKSDVIRQLNKSNLSSYSTTLHEAGSTIVFSSNLFFMKHQCVIELDSDKHVIRAKFT